MAWPTLTPRESLAPAAAPTAPAPVQPQPAALALPATAADAAAASRRTAHAPGVSIPASEPTQGQVTHHLTQASIELIADRVFQQLSFQVQHLSGEVIREVSNELQRLFGSAHVVSGSVRREQLFAAQADVDAFHMQNRSRMTASPLDPLSGLAASRQPMPDGSGLMADHEDGSQGDPEDASGQEQASHASDQQITVPDLVRHCREDDVLKLRSALESIGSHLESRDYVNLINAAREGDSDECVRCLLDHLKPALHDNLAIRLAAKLGLADQVEELLALPEVSPEAVEDAAIILACEFGNREVVRLLLKDPRVNAAARNDCPLRWGAQHGNLEIVEMLLADPRVSPAACENFAIRQASIRGHTEVVRRLLEIPAVNPGAKENRAIRLAAANGHTEVVRLLLEDPRVDPSARSNVAIIRAAKAGAAGVVELLLKHDAVDPTALDNSPLCKAAKHHQVEAVRVLLRDPRVDPSARGNQAILEAYRKLKEVEGAGTAAAEELAAVRAIVHMLITRKDVQLGFRNCVASEADERDFAEIREMYDSKIPKLNLIAKRGIAWRAALAKSSKTADCGAACRELPEREDLLGRIFSMAFGKDLILSRWHGDVYDSKTQNSAERLMSRLFRMRPDPATRPSQAAPASAP